MFIHHVQCLMPVKAREYIRFSRTGVTAGFKLSCVCSEWNLDPLQEQRVPLTTELSLLCLVQNSDR